MFRDLGRAAPSGSAAESAPRQPVRLTDRLASLQGRSTSPPWRSRQGIATDRPARRCAAATHTGTRRLFQQQGVGCPKTRMRLRWLKGTQLMPRYADQGDIPEPEFDAYAARYNAGMDSPV